LTSSLTALPSPHSWIQGGLLLRGGKGEEGKGDREGKEGIRKKERGERSLRKSAPTYEKR